MLYKLIFSCCKPEKNSTNVKFTLNLAVYDIPKANAYYKREIFFPRNS